jgi:hypothetical protein
MLCWLIAWAGFSPAALAEPSDTTEALVQRGLEARRQGRDAEALALFLEADARDHSPRIQAQIGLALHALGDWLNAEKMLQGALAARDDGWIEQHRAALQDAQEVVSKHLGWVVVHVAVPAGRVELPGQTSGAAGEPLRVPSGSWTILVSAPGHEVATRSVHVEPGATSIETITLTPLPRVAPASRPAVAERPAALARARQARGRAIVPPPAGWIAVGLGAGMLGYGSFLGVRTFQLKQQRDRECVPAGCSARGVVLDEQARSAALLATISMIAGAVVGAGGTWLVIREPAGSDEERRSRAFRDGAIVELSGRF